MQTQIQIAAALDLAVLKPTTMRADVVAAANLVEIEGIASICVAPFNVAVAKRITNRVCSVIGFPHGNTMVATKRFEAECAIDSGAIEIDVVVNLGRLCEGNEIIMSGELPGIIEYAHTYGVKVKAILETCNLNEIQIFRACEMYARQGVDWVKTSTGFARGGATREAVKTMLEAVKGQCGVKASGGINDYEMAAMYLDMGCTRIGSSKYWELLPK